MIETQTDLKSCAEKSFTCLQPASWLSVERAGKFSGINIVNILPFGFLFKILTLLLSTSKRSCTFSLTVKSALHKIQNFIKI